MLHVSKHLQRDNRRHAIILLSLCLVWPGAVLADPYAQVREQFQTALIGAAIGQNGAQDGAALKAYPLYPYLRAERLKWRVRNADQFDAEVGAFLTSQGDAPWTHSLRLAWLESLATRQHWTAFNRHYIDKRATDELRCYKGVADTRVVDDATTLVSSLKLWRTGKSQPDACDPVFAWLEARGALGVQEIAKRIGLALSEKNIGLANYLIRKLPAEQRSTFELWADALGNPSSQLPRAIQQGLPPQGIIDAFTRAARANPDRAAELLALIDSRCGNSPRCKLVSPGSIGDMRREIALNLSWSRRPETMDIFRQVPDEVIDERAHEWRVRAALWAGEWEVAEKWLRAMPEDMKQEQRWRYWLARSLEKQGRSSKATPIYRQLASENGYHCVLAAERLGQAYKPHQVDRPNNAAARQLMSESPAFARAHEAWRIEQSSWATQEWLTATRDYNKQNLLEAARLASSWGWHLMAVATSTRARIFDDFELLYPQPYKAELGGAAVRARLPERWVWSVMRQESLYQPRARSGANARGLLQLLPSTARAVARRNGLLLTGTEQLYDPSTNLLLGTAYLREQVDTFGGRFVLVLGAYNAGPNAVRRWLPDEPRETDVWIENVPFNETRKYIQSIIWHSTVFGWKSTGEGQRITEWMTPISKDLSPIANSP